MYNPYLVVTVVVLVAILLVYYVFRKVGRKPIIKENMIPLPYVRQVLEDKVLIFAALLDQDQEVFMNRVVYFLETTQISPEKGAVITDEDKILIAASGTIPLLHFQKWAYQNLDEVLVYPDYFDEKFEVVEEQRNVAGMVGNGALNHKMILSLPALRAGFQKYSEGNTAIHEFVHLIDKADGEIDGVPEYLIPKDLVEPWLKEMDKTIREIRQGKSEIRDYAATNDAEFLAVVSEYFFKKPKLLKEDHPKLYEMLDEIYNRKDN